MDYTYGVSDNLTLPMQANTKRSTQVAEQMQIQEKLISELAAVIERLEGALLPISRPTLHVNPMEEKELEQFVALATMLRTNNNFLIRNIQRLDNLIQSLEL